MAAVGWAPAQTLFGLHVDFGHYSTRAGRWLRLPEARFTCRWGCAFEATGAEYVTHFTARITAHHARHCPGLTEPKENVR